MRLILLLCLLMAACEKPQPRQMEYQPQPDSVVVCVVDRAGKLIGCTTVEGERFR